MDNKADVDVLVNLIKTNKVDLMAGTYDLLEEPVKTALVDWLESKNFPTDNPTEVIGNEYVLAWFSNNYKLFIFGLSIDDAEQCRGTIIFSFDDRTCKYVTDTVQCSD